MFLAVAMLAASTCVVLAGSEEETEMVGGYEVTYEAYCYASYGGASTSVYTPSWVETEVDASVTLYAYGGEGFNVRLEGSTYDYDDWYVDVVIDVLSPGYVGDHVTTTHTAYVNAGEPDSGSAKLYVYYE